MAWGAWKGQRNSRKGGRGSRGPTSSSLSHKEVTRAEYEATIFECWCDEKVSSKAKVMVEEVEVVLVVKRKHTIDTQILEEANEWIEDPIHS
jgi:L-cysteine desulfidase